MCPQLFFLDLFTRLWDRQIFFTHFLLGYLGVWHACWQWWQLLDGWTYHSWNWGGQLGLPSIKSEQSNQRSYVEEDIWSTKRVWCPVSYNHDYSTLDYSYIIPKSIFPSIKVHSWWNVWCQIGFCWKLSSDGGLRWWI